MRTIVDLFQENRYLKASKMKPECEMQWEVHFEQNISMMICLRKICQSNVNVRNQQWYVFLLLLRRFTPAQPMVENLILERIKMSRAFPRINFKFWNKVCFKLWEKQILLQLPMWVTIFLHSRELNLKI